MPVPLIAVLVFAAVALAAFTLLSFFEEREAKGRVLRERLTESERATQPSVTDNLELLRDDVLSNIPALDNILRRSERVSELQEMLQQGEVKTRAGNFLLLCLVSAVVVGFVVLRMSTPLLGWVGAIVGFFLPYAYASYRRAKRFERFEALFPEAIDTLARAVRAGHAFTTAIEMIGNEVSEPVAGEFRQLYEEQKFGLPVRDALMNLVERVPLVDVKFFVTAVMLQRETGGNLAEILDNLSYVIRERFKIQRQVKVYTAQGRLTMVLLMGTPPAIVVIMMMTNPSFIRPLFTDPIGHVLVTIGIILQTIGYFVIRRIMRIEV
jgi:tight adherence protein B